MIVGPGRGLERIEAALLQAAASGRLSWRAEGGSKVYRVTDAQGVRRSATLREAKVIADLLVRRVLDHEAADGFRYVNQQGRMVLREPPPKS
jgi:hypothetical protein